MTGDTQYHNDQHIRVQKTFTGLLAPPRLEVYKKDALFEKTIYSPEGRFFEVDSVRTMVKGDDLVIYLYNNKSDDTVAPVIIKAKR